MAARYSLVYGLSTALFGFLDQNTLQIGSYFSGQSAAFQTMFSTTVHAMAATWGMDNLGMPLGVGPGATRYVYLPLAAGAANALFGARLSSVLSGNDGGNKQLTDFLTEGLSAAIGVFLFARAF